MAETRQVPLDGLAPGAVDGWAAYVAGVLWAMTADGRPVPGMDVVVGSRVPAGAGLSSSAALECAVALAALELAGVPDTPEARRGLVDACVRAETEMVGAPTGGMDQSVALLAERGHALLLDFAEGTSTQVPWTPEQDGLTLLVVDTRVTHRLVDGGYASRRAECERAARELGVGSLREVQGHLEVLDRLVDPVVRRRARHVLTELDRVDAATDALTHGDHTALGPVLDASHASLRDDFEVSCAELDVAVETCRDHGALGARMTGGGFGGSAIALVPTDRLDQVERAVSDEFAARGWTPPGLLTAPASAGARRVR
jgi:galactokinase